MTFELTDSQQSAVDFRGGALLVSAAAGSGKTRVLVERLLSYVSEGKDIDSFLIITYTRAAAAELKSRILSRLNELVSASPDDMGLRRQATLCYRAQIGTIHSFCTSILRENAHCVGIAPDFAVLEEDRAESIKTRVMERLLDSCYEHIEEDVSFQKLTDTVGAGRDDTRLTNVLLQLHTKLMSHEWPERWAQIQTDSMKFSGVSDAGETIWGRELLKTGKSDAEYWRDRIDDLIGSLTSGDDDAETVWNAYGDSLSQTADGLHELCGSFDKGWDGVGVPEELFPRLGALRKPTGQAAEIAEKVKSVRNACKKSISGILKQFEVSSDRLLSDMEYMAPAMVRLLNLALEFDREYSAEKRRLGVVDFSDLEHFALKLLYDKKNERPTELAVNISGRYTEIMVDEYQDVNAVQDLIFSSVSKNGKNIFMVGDVKQSIYRFRLADPTIFLRRYVESEAYSKEKQTNDGITRILLKENFRSRAGVLKAANHVFKNIMSKQLGEMEYDDDAALVYGGGFSDEDPEITMTVIESGGADTLEDGESPGKTALEAAFVAKRIKTLVNSGMTISEGETRRAVRYGDIAILLRSPGGSGSEFYRALIEAGVPAESDRSAGFFSEPEVISTISLLAIIDNPRQDVALISAMRSPCFGFSSDDLASVRACDRDSDFYTALCAAAEKTEKAARFLKTLEELREDSRDMTVDALLRKIYDKTGMLTITSAMPDGDTRRENLMLLLDYAGKFEENGYRGLFMFNQWMKRLINRGDSPRTASVNGNAVTIMSIHKSKGLEFPVVFLCDTERRFNKRDMMNPVLIHTDLGLGPKYTDTARAVEWPTLPRRAIAQRMQREMLSEEMRVLYVAMTRAKECLFITAVMKNAEKTIEKLSGEEESPIAPQMLESDTSAARWLIRASLLPNSPIRLEVSYTNGDMNIEADNTDTEEEKIIEKTEAHTEVTEEFRGRMEFVYPYFWAEGLPSKLTATAVKETAAQDEEIGKSILSSEREFKPEFRKPELGAKAEMTAAQKGTATHKFMQYADFSEALAGEKAVYREAERLISLGMLSAEEGNAVDARAVSAFFRSDIGRRVTACKEPMREFRFSLLCDADEYYPVPSGEKLMLQGVVDCAIEEKDGITIIDYKTDSVFTDEEISARAEYYTPQIKTYAMALKRVTGKQIYEMVLYFLRARRAVVIHG